MKQFELRFLDGLDRVVLMRAYTGFDDRAALNEAQRLSKTHTIEVWQGRRRVTRLERENVSVFSNDQAAG